MPSARDLARADAIAALASRAADRHRDDEAGLVAAFLAVYWARASAEDVLAREPADLYGAALAYLHLGRRRSAGTAVVRVYSPTVADDGWQSTRSVLDIVTEDAPFLVDSVAMAVAELGVGVHLIVHPVQQTLAAVRAVVADWAPMRTTSSGLCSPTPRRAPRRRRATDGKAAVHRPFRPSWMVERSVGPQRVRPGPKEPSKPLRRCAPARTSSGTRWPGHVFCMTCGLEADPVLGREVVERQQGDVGARSFDSHVAARS